MKLTKLSGQIIVLGVKIKLSTWNSKKAYPLGGKYDLLSALWGQSTTSGPNRVKLRVISSGIANMASIG